MHKYERQKYKNRDPPKLKENSSTNKGTNKKRGEVLFHMQEKRWKADDLPARQTNVPHKQNEPVTAVLREVTRGELLSPDFRRGSTCFSTAEEGASGNPPREKHPKTYFKKKTFMPKACHSKKGEGGSEVKKGSCRKRRRNETSI